MILLSVIYCTSRDKTNKERVLSLMPDWCELVEIKNKGEKPLGYYRNKAVKQACGTYVVVIDDDDDITDDYFDELAIGISRGVDCICVMENQFDNEGKLLGFSVSGVKNPYINDAYQLRGCGHRDAVKRELVLKCGNYKTDVSRFEDTELSSRLYPLLKTAYYIDKPIYLYKSTKLGRLYDKHKQANLIEIKSPKITEKSI